MQPDPAAVVVDPAATPAAPDPAAIRQSFIDAGMSAELAATFTDEQLLGLAAMGEQAAAAFDEAPSRDEMIATLVEEGHNQADLEPLSDEELLALYEAEEEEPVAEMDEAVALTRDEMIAQLVALGKTEAELMSLTDEELAELLKASAATAPTNPTAAPVMMASERTRHRPDPRIAESERRMARIVEQQRQIEAQNNRRLAEERRATVELFCDNLVREGRLLPRQKPVAVARLLRADANRPVVEVFDERTRRTKKVTDLEAQMEEMRKAPVVVRFGETMPAGADGSDDEVAKVESYAEQIQSELRKMGRTPKQYVEVFREYRKRNPNMTADEYTSGGTARR
jgi:hypothetical protein